MPHYPSFPDCCQKLLFDLEREHRTGMRNCEKGHAVSIEYAAQVEAANAKKADQASRR